ncbi:MAG: type IV secretion system DNA-binding domain-containing protein [Candidatus Pacebacteria bacterium]|nr:type IV secretion system DNA-binding domain-containing protein [Candidatus Paceibacterota bacterium]MBP9842589.1 type IV secretion system DNA-binding domain-containing protein [Candidatus Paceibacterota bacterium]
MIEGVPRQFSSPQEELEFLRARIAQRERQMLDRTPSIDRTDIETLGKQEIKNYMSFTPKMVLDKNYELSGDELNRSVEAVVVSHNPVEDIMQLAYEKGIKNALTVLEQTNNTYIVDEVHRQLIEQIRSGAQIADLREGLPPWHILHMTLFEVILPSQSTPDGNAQQLAQLVGVMEQLLAGLRTIGSVQAGNHFVIEVAVADNSDDIVYYVAVPNEFATLFEKQTLSLFPHAVLTIQPHDYNIFADGGVALVSEVSLRKHPIYPLKPHDEFTADPFSVILNAFSKIEREGGGAALQFIVRYPHDKYRSTYESIIKEVEKGTKPADAIARSSMIGEFKNTVTDLFFTNKKKEEVQVPPKEIDTRSIELFRKKITTDIVETNIRMVVSAKTDVRAKQIMSEIESTFLAFNSVDGNAFVFNRLTGLAQKRALRAFSFRELSVKGIVPLSIRELATLVHFPQNAASGAAAPQFKQSYAQTAPAPTTMPIEGTVLGINAHRGTERKIFITAEDRLRHFYIIGQTGTGKTTLMKNMIVQDIMRGDGVCMIDPHGTDIEDVLAAVPPHREQDVIYFDPARLDRVIGLNMLEFDYSKPEQKTFVVNELFSIFKKLYGGNPESMGPMFEQYFRNATMLVMEDPESGNTLMDISRVMVDARYRRQKLEKATNPVVVQFWREIATKAGGEAALENIVPYIVSKFDVFTANDYMRPIIGQQRSAFNFRLLMDERKILLVNLAKGRIGEINANLIGMIFVGKLLMAALSRVDDPLKKYPPFYLHMDEFQNISTDSISAILSEARKYKLGLTMAHQFIAQLQPDIKDAVFGNVGSLAAFRVGPEDAQFLEQQYAPTFSASDLMNVPNRSAYMRILANGTPTPPFSLSTLPPQASNPERVAMLIEQSYARYGRARAEIEEEIRVRYQKPVPPPPPPISAMPDMI